MNKHRWLSGRLLGDRKLDETEFIEYFEGVVPYGKGDFDTRIEEFIEAARYVRHCGSNLPELVKHHCCCCFGIHAAAVCCAGY